MSKATQWAALDKLGLSDKAKAVIMGHAAAESGNEANRVQGDFGADRAISIYYTAKVDEGIITRDDFINHGPNGGGYGWLQWTNPGRKAGLYDCAKQIGVSIGSEEAAITWLGVELHQAEYATVLNALVAGNDIRAMSDVFMKRFERPCDQSESACAYRAKLCEDMYAEFAGTAPVVTDIDVGNNGAADACTIHPIDWKVAGIQLIMKHDGYWGEVDGLKSPAFFAALRQYTTDMENC